MKLWIAMCPTHYGTMRIGGLGLDEDSASKRAYETGPYEGANVPVDVHAVDVPDDVLDALVQEGVSRLAVLAVRWCGCHSDGRADG